MTIRRACEIAQDIINGEGYQHTPTALKQALNALESSPDWSVVRLGYMTMIRDELASRGNVV